MSVLCTNLNWPGLAREAKYQRRKLAECCGVSAGHLNHYFMAHFQRTPQRWLNEVRIREAHRLLCEGTSVKMAAYTLGFKQVSHFSRVFKEYYGFCPGECRNRYLSEEKNRLWKNSTAPDAGASYHHAGNAHWKGPSFSEISGNLVANAQRSANITHG
jgi:AraC-like DNA-binding protein